MVKGRSLTRSGKLWLGIVIASAMPAAAFAERQIVGDAAAVVRSVAGKYGAEVRQLKAADSVFFEEGIITQTDSASKIHFIDDTFLTVGPDSHITLDAFVYDPESKNSRMVVNATLGVARFVTGRMGSTAYQIKTPTATIGVRGTILTLTVEENGATSAVVEDGSITVQGQTGEPVEVAEGLSTTVEPGEPATEPAPPSPEVEAGIADMDVTLALGGGEQGNNDGIAGDDLLEIVDEVEQTRAAGCGC